MPHGGRGSDPGREAGPPGHDDGGPAPQDCLAQVQGQLSAAVTAGLPIGRGTVRDCTEPKAQCNWLDQRGILSRHGNSGWQLVLVLIETGCRRQLRGTARAAAQMRLAAAHAVALISNGPAGSPDRHRSRSAARRPASSEARYAPAGPTPSVNLSHHCSKPSCPT